MPALRTLARLFCLAATAWLPRAQCAEMQAVSRIGQPSQSGLCRVAVTAAETALHVPDAFLSAIAKVESGRPDPATGALAAWPWAVNAEGVGSFYATKAEAIAAVRALQARGVRSIDVGCMQVNLLQHPDAFASLDQAFDPAVNALYAAGFLVNLFHQTGSWPLAAAAYHSMTPTVGAPYERRVLAEWATPDVDPDQVRPRTHGAKPALARSAPPKEADESAPPVSAGQHGAAAWSPIGRAPVMGETMGSAAPAAGTLGRSLAAYRLLPVRMAIRAGHPGF